MIHPDCEKKILDIGHGSSVNQAFVDLFKAVAGEMEVTGAPSGTLVTMFYDEESDLKPGDLACELHFVVRRVADDSGSAEQEDT